MIDSDERTRDRSTIYSTIRLIPMLGNGNLLRSEALDVVGKDLSTMGMAFSHMSPLRHHRAAIEFSSPNAKRITVEVEVLWSRQTPIGLYESGCRMVRKLGALELPA